MATSRLAVSVGRLAVGAVATTAVLVPLSGIASAATNYGTGPAVNCTSSGGNGAVTVSATGFGPGATYSYDGSSSGSGNGSTFTVVGVPAGSVFTATVTQGSGATFQSCTSSFTVGGGAPATTTIVTPGGGGGSVAATPVSFTAPVAVVGTTKTTAVKPDTKPAVKVLAESVTRPGKIATTTGAASTTSAGNAATTTTAAAPSKGLAFTGSDDIVSGTILGFSLIAGGAGFIVATNKRNRRRARRS